MSTLGLGPEPVVAQSDSTQLETFVVRQDGSRRKLVRTIKWFRRTKLSASAEDLRRKAAANAPPIACPVCLTPRRVDAPTCTACRDARPSVRCARCERTFFPDEVQRSRGLCFKCWRATLTPADLAFEQAGPWRFPRSETRDNPSLAGILAKENRHKEKSPEEKELESLVRRWHRVCPSDYWAREMAALHQKARWSQKKMPDFPPQPEPGGCRTGPKAHPLTPVPVARVAATRAASLEPALLWLREFDVVVDGWDLQSHRPARFGGTVAAWKWFLAPRPVTAEFSTSAPHTRYGLKPQQPPALRRGMVRCRNPKCHAEVDGVGKNEAVTRGVPGESLGRWVPASTTAYLRLSSHLPLNACRRRLAWETPYLGWCDDCHAQATHDRDWAQQAELFPPTCGPEDDDEFGPPRLTTSRALGIAAETGWRHILKMAARSRYRGPRTQYRTGWSFEAPPPSHSDLARAQERAEASIELYGSRIAWQNLKTGRRTKSTPAADRRWFDGVNARELEERPPTSRRAKPTDAPSGGRWAGLDEELGLMAATLAGHRQPEFQAVFESLTDHQREVLLARFAGGLYLREIAAKFASSPQSIGNTLARIKTKFKNAGMTLRFVAEGRAFNQGSPTKLHPKKSPCETKSCPNLRIAGERFCAACRARKRRDWRRGGSDLVRDKTAFSTHDATIVETTRVNRETDVSHHHERGLGAAGNPSAHDCRVPRTTSPIRENCRV